MVGSNKQYTVNQDKSEKVQETNKEFNKMKQGYKEMAAINLALSNLYFEAESEAEVYYDRVAESE